MYLLSALFCYITALTVTVDSYVLLAANLDDFRSIAKKFVPEKLAEQIVEMASESGIKYREIDLNDKDSGSYSRESQQSHKDQSYEATTAEYKMSTTKEHKTQKFIQSQNRYEMKSAKVLTLDEIVEKVKERLQSELLDPAPSAPMNNMKLVDSATVSRPVYEYTGPGNEGEAVASYEAIQERPAQNQGYVPHNKRIVDRNRGHIRNRGNKRISIHQETFIHPGQEDTYIDPVPHHYVNPMQFGHVKHTRYVQHVPIPDRSKKQVSHPSSIVHKPLKKNKQLVSGPLRPKQIKITTQKSKVEDPVPLGNYGKIFEEVDMLKSNDSYEDYVTPQREEVFASDEPEETNIPSPAVPTVKYKPTNRAPTASTTITTTAIDDVQVLEIELKNTNGEADTYDYETTDGIFNPEELKARTESLSYEEKEPSPDPNATTTTEVTIKGKPVKKIGTMIPTREYYKLSSPNYYAQLPVIAEKYNFNEPIPEQDRVHEKLKFIGNPPASINGKVMLL